MPTHGYGPFRSLLLGSVTAKVLHDSECPVWTGAHMDTPPVAAHIECRRILCALDLSPKSRCILTWAAEYAHAYGAELRLIHVLPEQASLPARQLDREFMEERRAEAKDCFAKLKDATGIHVPSCRGARVGRTFRRRVCGPPDDRSRASRAELAIRTGMSTRITGKAWPRKPTNG